MVSIFSILQPLIIQNARKVSPASFWSHYYTLWKFKLSLICLLLTWNIYLSNGFLSAMYLWYFCFEFPISVKVSCNWSTLYRISSGKTSQSYLENSKCFKSLEKPLLSHVVLKKLRRKVLIRNKWNVKLKYEAFLSNKILNVSWKWIDLFIANIVVINLLEPNAPFLYHLKMSENRKPLVFWHSQGVKKWNVGMRWVKNKHTTREVVEHYF